MKNKHLLLVLLLLLFAFQATKAQMSGIYSIGGDSGDDYSTIFLALTDLNNNGADGPVIFELSAFYNPGSEIYPVLIQAFPGASAANTLTIKPESGTTHLIQAATGSILSAVFTILDAGHIIIDGSNNGTDSRDLTIINTAEIDQTAPVALFTNSTPGTDITIKNCILKAHSNTYQTAGIFADQYSDVTIENNEISQSSIGVICTGDDIMISNNMIGSDTQSEYVSTAVGINTGSNINISNNRFKNLIFTLDDNVMIGSYLMDVTGTCVFENNKIDSVINTGTGSAIGLFIKDCLPDQMDIINNHFSHIASDNYSDQMPVALGIDCPGMTSGLFILYNTISMDEDNTYGIGSGADNGMSAGLFIHQGSGIVMDNNIIMNALGERDASVYSTSAYAIVCSEAVSPFDEVDNNVYYSDGDNDYNFLAFANGSSLNLADWQTWTGSDSNSFFEDPLFESSDDLRLQACSPAVAHAVDIPFITIDIEGNIRDTEYPTMGAYEFEKIQAENLDFAYPVKNVGSLYWEQGTGCKTVVFMKQGNVLPESPIPLNGTTYIADENFGMGDEIGTSAWYCVYNDYYAYEIMIYGDVGDYTAMACEYYGNEGHEIYLIETAINNPNTGSIIGINMLEMPYLSIYPNPTADKITVDIDPAISNQQNISINIVDITGKAVKKINHISSEKIEIELSKYSKGIYFVNITGDFGSYSEKLILK